MKSTENVMPKRSTFIDSFRVASTQLMVVLLFAKNATVVSRQEKVPNVMMFPSHSMPRSIAWLASSRPTRTFPSRNF